LKILGVERLILDECDRLLQVESRYASRSPDLIRAHRPRLVFTTQGDGAQFDHRALTDIVVAGVFYARLPKWGQVEG
jgi:LmbE family N-acetylglucosaminyl deacetylase